MIVTFDTETRGLFGEIFAMGWYDGEKYHPCTPSQFLNDMEKLSKEKGAVYAYAHNLDFDLSKLWKVLGGLDVDWNKTIVIHHTVARLKLKDMNVFLCDSLKLFPASLDRLSKDFELNVPKMDLSSYILEKGYKDKDDFFKNVPSDDPVLNKYLEIDCKALYELIRKTINISGLEEEDFIKSPTTPALALRIYRTLFPDDYEKITSNKMTEDLEEFSRKAYIGGRVEVVKPILKGEGYHYDVNSLYPSVMKANSFPVGKYAKYDGTMADSAFLLFRRGKFKHCIVKAKVDIPVDLKIPPLPYRDKKLYFPVGRIVGYWTGEELLMAERYGVKICHIEEGYFWKDGEKIFHGFIKVMEREKTTSKGARRSFFKLIQNSLYGKFGMQRERESYYNPEDEEKIKESGKPYLKVKISVGEVIISSKTVFSKYVRPYIAAYVTSYARMVLYEAIMRNPNHVWYYDTDSLVTDIPLPEELIDENEYGKWKLERVIGEGIFLQPKLYAEKTKEGKEELKSKGLIRDYRETMTFETYRKILNDIRSGKEVIELYSGIKSRRKFITALKEGKDLDEIVYLKKKINLMAKQKRIMDYLRNDSMPIQIIEW